MLINTVVNVSADNDAVQGSSSATVTMIEFSDFQCSFVIVLVANISKIKAAYIDTGKVNLFIEISQFLLIHKLGLRLNQQNVLDLCLQQKRMSLIIKCMT